MARQRIPGDVARGFVGRGDAMTALADELHAAAAGSSRIVWIEGEAGIGKSTLMRRFLDDARGDHFVVWAGGAEEERLLPFGVVAQLLVGLGVEEDPASPGLTEWDDPLEAGAQLLAALGEVAGLSVVVVDDLHWVDAQSASALLFALRRVEREALLVVLATRPHPASAVGDGWGRLLRDETRVRRIGLEGLRAEELVHLAEATVGARLGGAGAEGSMPLIGTDIPIRAFQQLQRYTTEAVVWRDAQTGAELARSSELPKMTQGILVTPGYAGLQYFLTADGHIIALQVAPAPPSTDTD